MVSATVRWEAQTIGHSLEGRSIKLYRQSDQPLEQGGTLLIGGFHGDEPATVALLHAAMREPGLWLPETTLLPLLNPDGFERASRYNAQGVDLNRNFETGWNAASEEPSGPEPWSEPESRLLRDLILTQRPERIVTLHWALGEIDADGPQSTPLARAMWHALDEESRQPYRLRTWHDGELSPEAACPGSFGQWCGYGVRYPDGGTPAIVTLELPYDPSLPRPDPLPEDHLAAVHETWDQTPEKYLEATWPAVRRMLEGACQFNIRAD